MHCPTCKTVNLVMSERQGVEIDYCPQCRGVWLDRGELDKIIEKSSASFTDSKTPPSGAPYPSHSAPAHPHPSSMPHGGYYKKKKRESFLSDLFDF